ncbi:hypothetical protein CI610_03631 [invertebrate metagenome]|uniref:Uncharacterized protein n=1 Tax=invertebrate metagenome TaxID=1711999 RepID=A0A2H9T2L2_9ZZZZ
MITYKIKQMVYKISHKPLERFISLLPVKPGGLEVSSPSVCPSVCKSVHSVSELFSALLQGMFVKVGIQLWYE